MAVVATSSARVRGVGRKIVVHSSEKIYLYIYIESGEAAALLARFG